MKNSKIEWTDHTFNPWWGCVKVSPACTHCYAESFAKRTGHDVWGEDKPRRFFGEKHWEEPLKWNASAEKAGERHKVFCASMADVFEDYSGPDSQRLKEERQGLWHLIQDTPNLDWLLLTKRPENVLRFVPPQWKREFPRNVWMGTTVENQEMADKRIPELLKIPARIRFLSMEPLLGEVNLVSRSEQRGRNFKTLTGTGWLGPEDPKIHWVICGGEADPHRGRSARPMHPHWAQTMRNQCQAAGVPFFFKQWGDWKPSAAEPVRGTYTGGGAFILLNGRYGNQGDWWAARAAAMDRVGKNKSGRLLDGIEWNEFPAQEFHHEERERGGNNGAWT